jgi:hypothetical protein
MVAKKVKEFMSETVLYVLFGFCLIGTSTETLYSEDQNAFLNAFFEAEEELMNGITIRYAVIDLFEDVFLNTPIFSRESL